MAEPLRQIAVFGGGITALAAANALAQALPGATVELIATPIDPAALADRLPGTLPSTRAFHQRIGLPEDQLLQHSATTHRLATRFDGWSRDGTSWWRDYGGLAATGVGQFHQHWLALRRAGADHPLAVYQLGAALAAANRLPAMDAIDHALRLDLTGYRTGLAALARHRRIVIGPGSVAAIERGERGIAAVTLDDGRRITADLFIDATGAGAALLSSLDDRIEDWTALLPCNRLLVAHDAPGAAAADTVRALDCGWLWCSPGRDGTMLTLAFSAALTPADEAARRFAELTGRPPAETIAVRPGRRAASWVGNVVALGDAAVTVDPLETTNLHLAHHGIEQLLALLPDRRLVPELRAAYNRRVAAAADRVRDFIAAHYARSGRSRGELWRHAARMPLPEPLARVIELFEARGRLPHREHDAFEDDDWQQVLLGMGVMPRHPDAGTMAMPGDRRIAMMAAARERIAATVRAAPLAGGARVP